jgi:hypothetical protein
LSVSSLASLSVALKIKFDYRRLVFAGQFRLQKNRWTEMWKRDAQRQIAHRLSRLNCVELGNELLRLLSFASEQRMTMLRAVPAERPSQPRMTMLRRTPA